MGVICEVELQDGRTGKRVRAELVTLADNHVADYEDIWLAALREYGEADQGFSWRFKQNLIERHDSWEGYAIEHRGLTQGLILLETQTSWSIFTQGQRTVRVDALASAPWNRSTIQRPRDLKGVGGALLNFARIRSHALGYEGRVGLYSLPDAVGFYER